MFNTKSVKAQLEQAPHSTKEAEGKASYHRLLPDLLSKSATHRSMFSHHTPLQTVTGLPGWERLPNTATVGSPSSSNTATKPLAFPDTTGPEPDGSSMLPAQAPNPHERAHLVCPFLPNDFVSKTFNIVLHILLIRRRANAGLLVLGQESTSLFQSRLLGHPYLHMSPHSRDMLPLDTDDVFSCTVPESLSAIMRQPHMAHAFIVSTEI